MRTCLLLTQERAGRSINQSGIRNANIDCHCLHNVDQTSRPLSRTQARGARRESRACLIRMIEMARNGVVETNLCARTASASGMATVLWIAVYDTIQTQDLKAKRHSRKMLDTATRASIIAGSVR